jgi:hypothetical protein
MTLGTLGPLGAGVPFRELERLRWGDAGNGSDSGIVGVPNVGA